jgi:hypothetical protein
VRDATFTDPGTGGENGKPCDPDTVYFQNQVLPLIISNCANNDRSFGAVNHDPGYKPMPNNSPKLAKCKIDQIRIWIENGTPNN